MAKQKNPKYIFVTGGVLSGVGKGITAASIGKILKARGLKVNIQKCDPYLNVDAGTLNPAEHGECFVTIDGAETDLDLGHYERFLDTELQKTSSLISGRLLREVIEDERAGKYLGKTVQVVPHVTGAIVERIKSAAEGFDVHIVEVGGTVGDYESPAFIEAIRELGLQVGPQNSAFVHVVYLPYLAASNEIKTKPAQNAVRDLRGMGIVPNILVARSDRPADGSVRDKLALFSGLNRDSVVLLPNAETIYEVPLTLEQSKIADVLIKGFGLKYKKPDLGEWRNLVSRATDENLQPLKIAVIAKYLDNEDTYMSIFEALRAAAWLRKCCAEITWIDSEKLNTKNVQKRLEDFEAVVVPGGFGQRGVEGMILAADYCLRSQKPFYGICLGLQVSVIAAARRAGLKGANSTEFDVQTKYPVVATMADQIGKEATGGTMRLGGYTEEILPNTLARSVYGSEQIIERHRHRYECNNDFVSDYQNWGIRVSATSPNGELVEMIEGLDHPFFLAAQSHPEFNSRPNRPHKPFIGLIDAAIEQSKRQKI